MKRKLAENIPELLKLSPVRKKGELSPREKAWRSYLKSLSSTERRKIIQARRQFAKKKKDITPTT